MITVTAAIIERDNLILAARKRQGLPLAGYWEFPGGKVEQGEDPRHCLTRELEEELGIRTIVGEYLGESVFSYPEKTIRLIGYFTQHIGGEFHLSDHDELRWLPVHELKRLNWAPADIPLVESVIERKLTRATLSYYEQNARAYTEKTLNHEMQAIRDRFLEQLPPGAHILDLGCGSGRDSQAFLKGGFQLTPVDGSPAVAALAAEYLQQKVHVLRVQEIDWQGRFDGVWACAVLVHIPKADLLMSLQKLHSSLKTGGMLYFSVKEGLRERWDELGRFFSDYQREEIAAFVHQLFAKDAVTITISTSCQNGIEVRWLNVFARKTTDSNQ